MTVPLYLTRVEFDAERLHAAAKRTGAISHDLDLGYAVHALLVALFGKLAPHPFAIERREGRSVVVLGYTAATAADLRGHANAYADPLFFGVCRWEELAAKAMPVEFRPGARLGFAARVCPVVRMAKAGAHHRAGAEVDAFLARCWTVGEGTVVDRADVYRDWLTSQLEKRGAKLIEYRIDRFQRERLVRKDHTTPRAPHRLERPDVDVGGVVEVADDALFRALLARGVGRHRAFGFGMLKLRPA